MRRFLLLFLFYCSQSVSAQSYFRLSGTITHPTQDFVTFTYYANWVSEPKEYTLKLSADSSFLVEFPLSEIAYCDLSFGENGIDLLKIEPGDDIHFTFSNSDFYGTASAKGSGSAKWEYRLSLKRQFEVDRDWDAELGNFKKMSRVQFFRVADSLASEQRQLLKYPQNQFSEPFSELELADITGKFKQKEFGYLNANNLLPETLKINWGEFNEDTKGKSMYLGQLAETVIDNALSKNKLIKSRTQEYEFIKGYKNSIGTGILERILAAKLLEYVNQDGLTEEIKYLAEDYLFFSDNVAYKKVLASYFKKKQQLEVGKQAPNFILKNVKGKLTELSDFRGKNIVLGFYDNDCFFCKEDIAAMEFVEGFYKRLGKSDFIFLFINLSTYDDFKSFLKSEKPMGVHLNGFNDSFLKKNYNLDIIPNYLIIDRYGKIVDNTIDEPRLDDGRQLIEEIDRIFYKK